MSPADGADKFADFRRYQTIPPLSSIHSLQLTTSQLTTDKVSRSNRSFQGKFFCSPLKGEISHKFQEEKLGSLKSSRRFHRKICRFSQKLIKLSNHHKITPSNHHRIIPSHHPTITTSHSIFFPGFLKYVFK